MAEIILHHYPRSPYAEKIRVALGVKGLAWRSVQIPPWMPKPDLMPLTGGYRRTPVLQVGADIYCDTLMILRAIEHLQPSPTFFAPGAGALGFGIERAIFMPVIGIIVGLTGHTYPRELVVDRLPFFGMSLEQADMLPKQAEYVNRVQAHAALLAEMLADGRRFLLGDAPSAADLAAYHPIWHLRRAGGIETAAQTVTTLLPTLRPLLPWLDRMAAIGHGRPTDLEAKDALAIAAAADPMPLPAAEDAAPLQGLAVGDMASVMPDDSGRDPVTGCLVAVTEHAIVLARNVEGLGTIHVHFPRVGFEATRA